MSRNRYKLSSWRSMPFCISSDTVRTASAGLPYYIAFQLLCSYDLPPKDHDMIAGAKGAYRDTLLGLYNLALCGISIELRIILCALNYKRLYNISLFIHRNLPFVEWIAFMGMEQTGYAVKNAKKIWIEPINYQEELLDAVKLLADWNYHVSIFNIPLCLLPTYLHDYARKSISDWKNHYAPICDSCVLKMDCCGFFSTSKNYFQGIRPFCQNTVE